MRIVAGAWRGRPLVAPAGIATRPTADRVRETLFSMLVSRIGGLDGLTVADLYAGSGALGFEALSRGAQCVTFVETAPAALAAIRANAAALKAEQSMVILPVSALDLPKSVPFDLVFADPPYAAGSGSAAARAIAAATWLAPSGLLSVETARGDRVVAEGLEVAAERDVGRARLTLFRSSISAVTPSESR